MDIKFALVTLSLPAIMEISGLLMMLHPPKTRNVLFGYRTRRSLLSQETWDFANYYGGTLYVYLGFYITAAEVAAVLQNEMRKVSALPPAVDLSGTLEDIERRVIEQVLREENMNQSAAAKRLGIGRSTLWRKIAGSGGK